MEIDEGQPLDGHHRLCTLSSYGGGVSLIICASAETQRQTEKWGCFIVKTDDFGGPGRGYWPGEAGGGLAASGVSHVTG